MPLFSDRRPRPRAIPRAPIIVPPTPKPVMTKIHHTVHYDHLATVLQRKAQLKELNA